MSFIGTVAENGSVTLPPEANLPVGMQVRVIPVASHQDTRPVGQKLLELAGVIKDWPPDFAANHDHYLHGAPKRTGS